MDSGLGAAAFILSGIGVWLLVEGAICALAPDFVRRITAQVARLPAGEIAIAGLIAAAIGASLVVVAVRTA